MKKLTAILLALTLVLTLLPMAVLADDPPATEPDETTIIPLVDDCEHTLQYEQGIPATCTDAGLAAHWYCTNCGKTFQDEAGTVELSENDLIIPAPGHALQYAAEGNVITETCANCDHSATATITATGATYTGQAIETATVAYSENWQGGELQITYADNTAVGNATASITISNVTATTTFAIASAVRKGDMDGNGTINMRDLLTLRQYLAGGYGIELSIAVGDLDGNGSINMRDLLTLRQYLAGGYGIEL